MGSYLDEAFQGDIRRRKEIGNLFDDTRHGDKAQKMITAYEKWLGESVELSVLRLLGLFDRPAALESIAALRAAPAIPGLTDMLQNLKVREWQQSLAKLRRIKLLGAASSNDPNTLHAHPLVREHFKQQLKLERPAAWREGNKRLYEYLKSTAKESPDTMEEMLPLFAAISHGCAAGEHPEALDEIYWRRIQRQDSYYNWNELRAFGADLAALSGFFETPWQEPVAGLKDSDKAFVLLDAGCDLRALGELREAAQPIQVALEMFIGLEDWENAAIAAENCCELYITIGDLRQALWFAQHGVELADRSNAETEQRDNRTTLANALYQVGRESEAAAYFDEVEELQHRQQPAYPFLYWLSGFQYCDLLLGRQRIKEVKERVARMLVEWPQRNKPLLYHALDNLSLGRAWLLDARAHRTGFTQAAEFLELALDGLRQARQIDYLPLALLARAELHRFTRDYSRAERDLAEALRIAKRGGMGLHLADYHLESARLHLAQGNKDKSREHWKTAKGMIERMGYHRRDNEVNELAEQLG